MRTQKGYDVLEVSDLKPGMVLKFRNLQDMHEMRKKELIVAGWNLSMDKFAERNITVTITKEMIEYFESHPGTKFERGVISSEWTFSLSMFEIKEYAETTEIEEEKNTLTSEEERGISMKLGEIFVSNEKETLQEAIAVIQPEKCLSNLRSYLLSGASGKGALEKSYLLALRKKLPTFMVELHVNASKDTAEELLKKVLADGFAGFSQKEIDALIGDINKYNSVDSHKLVVAFMKETLEEVIADAARTAKEQELLKLKEQEALLVELEQERVAKLKELQKQIKELEA